MAVRPGGAVLPGRPRLLAPAAVIVLLLLIGAGVFVSQYTDYLWFQEAQHTNVFTTVLRTKLLLFVVGALVMGVLIGVNISIAYRNRPPFRPVSLEQQNLERYRVALEPFLVPVLLVISAFFGIFAGLSSASRWRTWLLWRNGQSFGVKDPQFHKDISYFTFTYPFQRFVLGFVLVVLVLSLIAAAITHYLFGGVRLQTTGEKISVAARVHLSVLVGLIVMLKAVAYWLDRYGLAFSTRGVVQGASYTDVNAVLPAKTMLALVAVICALLFFANIVVRNVVLPAGALALLVVSAIVVGGIYPLIVQTYQVKPNEITKETKYIQRNIDATRSAYQIKTVDAQDYTAVSTATKADVRNNTGTVPNIRLLDPNILGPTFRQRQALRNNYFAFNNSLDIDRYADSKGKIQDYVVAVRELDQSRLSSQDKNWINLHLAYTHGNGLVAAPANQTDSSGEPVFTVGGLPQTGTGDFAIDKPQIYYGEQSPEYSIVDTKQGEIDGPGNNDKSSQATTHYDGTGGIKLNSGVRKLLFALKFRDKNILLSGSLTKDSKLMYIRNPADRVQKVAPFLQLDSDPYPAVVDGRILWIVDGYTTSAGYPYSQTTTFGKATTDSQTNNANNNDVNYIRNSVKATVDAYSGKVTLYTWDSQDPVLKTWGKAFSGLLQPKSSIPTDLAKHFRYPEDYFKVQRELLTKYHVTDPSIFYGGEDFWQIPGDPTQSASEFVNSTSTTSPSSASSTNEGPAQPPYYVLLQMPGTTGSAFSLTSTFVARNGTNLTAFAAVSSDPGTYGDIRLLELPKGTVVDGPGQVANTFESDPTISTQLSLLRQGGSEVKLGNLLTLPVGGGLLYVEPVYTQSKSSPQFPILKRVIVSFGGKVAFQPTLALALDDLFGQGSGSNVVGPTPSPGSTGSPTGETVAALITAAQTAYDDGQAALKKGDFAAYGKAQDALKRALDQLATATKGTVSPSASASPSSSASATPSPSPSR